MMLRNKIIEILNHYVDFSIYSAEKNILNAIADEILALPLYEKEFVEWFGNYCIELHGQYGSFELPEHPESLDTIDKLYKYWKNLPK